MKILMITPDYIPSFGGIGVHVSNLILSLKEYRNCEITLLICRMRRPNDGKRLYDPNPKVEEYFYKDIRILDFNSEIQTKVDQYHKSSHFFEGEAYHDFRTITNCSDIEIRLLENLTILDKHYDLIHLHDAFNGPLAVLLKEIYHCPLVTSIHGINAEEFTMIDNLKRYVIFNSNFLITVNSEIKELIKKRYLAIKPTEVVYNSIDLLEKEEILHNINADFNPPYVITFCGRIDMLKGLDILLKALKILIEKGNKVSLFVIGDGLLKNEMEKLSQLLEIDQQVTFLGILKHHEVIEYYKRSYCIIVPSIKEPFSTVALEGMASGVPVICSNIGGFSEMITDGKDGILFTSGDARDLSDKIINLFRDWRKRKEIASNAIKTVEKKYTWTINAKKTLKIYKKVIDKG